MLRTEPLAPSCFRDVLPLPLLLPLLLLPPLLLPPPFLLLLLLEASEVATSALLLATAAGWRACASGVGCALPSGAGPARLLCCLPADSLAASSMPCSHSSSIHTPAGQSACDAPSVLRYCPSVENQTTPCDEASLS